MLASVPVAAREGNEGGMFIARLPVGVPDADERLRIIRRATAKGKDRPDQGVAGIVVLPASLARLGVAWARRAAASHVNLYVTNVPGPPSALYCAGARLLEAVPLAPLVAGVRLSVTALSYDGQFAVSLLGDNNMVDMPVLRGYAPRSRAISSVRPALGIIARDGRTGSSAAQPTVVDQRRN